MFDFYLNPVMSRGLSNYRLLHLQCTWFSEAAIYYGNVSCTKGRKLQTGDGLSHSDTCTRLAPAAMLSELLARVFYEAFLKS